LEAAVRQLSPERLKTVTRWFDERIVMNLDYGRVADARADLSL
jgi:hypothetical protein